MSSPVNVFISYAREDIKYLKEFLNHLSGLQRIGIINSWFDSNILAGDKWNDEIKKKLGESEIIIFLISSDFMASDFINDVEMKIAFERHSKNEVRIIPIVIRSCDYSSLPLTDLQLLPTNGKPVKSSYWFDEDAAWESVVKEITILIDRKSSELDSVDKKFDRLNINNDKFINKPKRGRSFQIAIILSVLTLIFSSIYLFTTNNQNNLNNPRVDTTHTIVTDSLVGATVNVSFSPQQIKHTTRNLTYKIIETTTEALPDKQVVFTLKIKCVNDSKYEYNFYAKYIRVKIGEDSYPPSPYSPSEAYQAIDAQSFKNLEYNYKLPAGIKNFTLVFYDEGDQIGTSAFTVK